MLRPAAVSRVVLATVLLSQFAMPLMAASPRLSSITPRGFKRGAEHTVQFNGSNLADIEEVLFYEPAGFTVTKVEPNGNNPKVTISVSPDCRLGEHVAQVRTKSGLSDYRTFYVEELTAVAEAEPNNEFTTPQPIALNVVVDGNIGNEDVDYYVVDAKKGQRISVEVVAMRLGTALFDPYVAILDSKRFELSANDDTALALQDGYAAIVAPEDGKYIIEVRESAYGAGSSYRLHVGTFPRPTAVYPAGGKLGEEVDVKFLGLPDGELAAKLKLPAEPVTDYACSPAIRAASLRREMPFSSSNTVTRSSRSRTTHSPRRAPSRSRWRSTASSRNRGTSTF